MKTSATWRTLALLLLLVFLASCRTTADIVGLEDTQNIVVLRNGEALEKDAAAYAEAFGVSQSEALRRLKLQPLIGELGKKLSQKYPETYAGVWIKNDLKYEIVVAATDNLDDYSSLIQQTPFSKEVTIVEEEKSLQTLVNEQQAAIVYLEDQNIESESEVNVKQNRVDVFVHNKSDAESSFNSLSTTSVATPNVNFIETPRFSQPLANMYAGLKLGINNTVRYCTSGFTMRTTSNLFVTATAGHCGGELNHNGARATVVSRNFNGSFDIEHIRIPGAVYKPWAKDDEPNSGGTRYYREIITAYGRLDVPMDAWVCKFGESTGHTCGKLATTTFRPSSQPAFFPAKLNGATFVRLDRVGNTQIAAGGDSGGSVYIGHAAIGSVSGGWPNNCGRNLEYLCGDMVYMASNFMLQNGKYQFAIVKP